MNDVTNIDQVTVYIGGRNIDERSVVTMMLVSIEIIFDRTLLIICWLSIAESLNLMLIWCKHKIQVFGITHVIL